ncbi:unnamed protein product, partial [Rotaria sp. Silwood1]
MIDLYNLYFSGEQARLQRIAQLINNLPDQSSSQQSISNSYAVASTILELMIIHHKQLFKSSSQQEQTSKSFKYMQSTPGYPQPAPGTHRKNKAPPPPTSSS